MHVIMIGYWELKISKPRNNQQLRKSIKYTTIDCAKGHLKGWVLPIPNHKAPYNSKAPRCESSHVMCHPL